MDSPEFSEPGKLGETALPGSSSPAKGQYLSLDLGPLTPFEPGGPPRAGGEPHSYLDILKALPSPEGSEPTLFLGQDHSPSGGRG